MISIIIPAFNQLGYTRQCVDHIQKYTDIPYELIMIDNGSTDGTGDFLKTQSVQIISNENNKGVYSAWNQGLKASKSDFIVIMNNDILVTPHWMSALLQFSRENPRRVVGPAMREGALNYPILEFSGKLTGACLHAKRVNELCNFSLVLFRRSFLDEVGLFDEQFFVARGDDDMILRLKQREIGLAVTGSSFVHHYSEKTQEVKTVGFDIKEIRINDDRLFQRKWGTPAKPSGFRKLIKKGYHHWIPLYEKIRYGYSLKIEKPRNERLVNKIKN